MSENTVQIDKNEIALMENGLGIKSPIVTREQVQAAYALNLCAVSVSQIIDYNDIHVLEQEYEVILNNLNLENIPKDEALLNIIKRLLETIAFFRIQEGEKEFIEKDYQYKMKNAIWSAMPNPGALISTGLSKGMARKAISLAASVGTAYMNYRKNKAEYQMGRDKQYWELKKAAIEQFQALQQQLLETSWRLADKYKFPDVLRLSERQIKQYNKILMDTDEIRKFERLESIKHKFAAYPPFWYFYGNTANSIAISDHYGLDEEEKEYYRNHARKCFAYFTEINKYDILREDEITATCYLEYVDLLDCEKDKDKIRELITKAVVSAGNSYDVLQLCAIAYMKVKEYDKAAYVLRQLVNEQYNEVTNAQLLSTIYVNKYIETQNIESKASYRLLETRVNEEYLYPFPEELNGIDKSALEREFIKTQRKILKEKYRLIIVNFIKKYEARINSIIPLPAELEHDVEMEIYADKASARSERIKQVQLVLCSGDKGERYRTVVQNIPYSYKILEILNEMFASICLLEFAQDQNKQLVLLQYIKESIHKNSDLIQKIEHNLKVFDEKVYGLIQGLTLRKLTNKLFMTVADEIKDSVERKTEMKDFSIAELNLMEFCKREGFEQPEVMYSHRNDVGIEETIRTYFTPELLGETVVKHNERIQKNEAMIKDIKDHIKSIVLNSENIEFYTSEDPRINRYFYNKALQKHKAVRPMTLAVLDDRSKGDMDLLFTVEGIMPIIKGKCKKVVTYDSIKWSENSKKKELMIRMKYSNDNLDMDSLYSLITKLSLNEANQEERSFS